MKNFQKGFVVPLLIGVIALLVIGGSIYIYENKKAEVPVVTNTEILQPDQVQQQTNTQPPQVTNQKNSSNNNAPNSQKILNSLITDWKKIGPGFLPGLPPLSQAFYGYPSIIQFIGNNHVIISYENDFNPLFAVLNYDSNKQQFTYLDGHGTPDFTISKTLWNTWRKKYGDISFTPQTFQFSSTRTGDAVYPSDWKPITKNPFISNNVSANVPLITILYPNGGENLIAGKGYLIKWDMQGIKDDHVKIEVVDENGQLELAASPCLTDTRGLGARWTVPNDIPAGRYKIYITTCSYPGYIATQVAQDQSDNYFTIQNLQPQIAPVSTQPYVYISSPIDLTVWHPGSSHEIKWNSSGLDAKTTKVSLSIRSVGIGGSDTAIALLSDADINGSYVWKIPSTIPISSSYLIEMSAYYYYYDLRGKEQRIVAQTTKSILILNP